MSKKLLKSASVVSSVTLVSRITGLIRDVIFANILGDKAAADVFFVAFRIPNFFRRIFGEGAFSAAFIPVFTEYRMEKSKQETNLFLQLLIGRFGLILLAISALGVVFAPALVTVLAAGFLQDPEKFDLAVRASRITFPYIFFISFVAMAAGMLNTCGRFAAPAATPVLLNICLIGAALILVPMMHSAPIALSIGVLLAGVAQLLFQIPFLRKEKLSIQPRIVRRPGDEVAIDGAKRVFKLTVPAVFGVSVAQINVIVNTILASFLVTGSISWLYYSDRLMEFPVGVFGIALSTVILPHLSRKHTEKSPEKFSSTLDWAARWVVLICIPSTVGLVVLSEPIVTTIYYHGDFTETGIRMTAMSLIAYSVGMTAIVMVKILAPGFYARQNTKTPVRVGMIAMALNIIFSLALVYPFKHVGLASATSISALFNATMLYLLLKKEKVFIAQPGWLLFGSRVVCGSVLMGMVIGWLMAPGEYWLTLSVWHRVWDLFVLIAVGGVTYLVTVFALGIKPRSLWLKSMDVE